MDYHDETERVFRDYINQRLEQPGSKLLVRAGGPAEEPSSAGFSCNNTASKHFARLVTQAEGIFQYLVAALADIEKGTINLDDVQRLPQVWGRSRGDQRTGAVLSKHSTHERYRAGFWRLHKGIRQSLVNLGALAVEPLET